MSGECKEKKRCQEEVKKKREEKEKTKMEKAKAAAMAALAAPRPKCDQRALKKFDETSSDSESSDSDAVIYEDSSNSKVNDMEDNFEGSTSFCTKCLTVFKVKDKETVIGCYTPYCR